MVPLRMIYETMYNCVGNKEKQVSFVILKVRFFFRRDFQRNLLKAQKKVKCFFTRKRKTESSCLLVFVFGSFFGILFSVLYSFFFLCCNVLCCSDWDSCTLQGNRMCGSETKMAAVTSRTCSGGNHLSEGILRYIMWNMNSFRGNRLSADTKNPLLCLFFVL